jgi:hypothetical protein
MKICPKCGSNKVIMFDADNDLCEKCQKWFPAVKDIKPEWKTICEKCAIKHKILDAWRKSEHCVLSDFGVDSICDLCGEENGGSVMQVLIRRIKK